MKERRWAERRSRKYSTENRAQRTDNKQQRKREQRTGEFEGGGPSE
jgi:hypothetical protein